MKKRTSRECKTLAIFVQSLEGSRVVVELTNDTIVRYVDGHQRLIHTPMPHCNNHQNRGQLDTADIWGNLQLSDARIQPLQRPPTELPYVFVRASSVRFIHLPPTLDPEASIRTYRKRLLLSARSAARAGAEGPRGKLGVAGPATDG